MASGLLKAYPEKEITKLKTLLKSPKQRKTINTIYTWPSNDSIKSPVLSCVWFSITHDFVNIILENNARDDIEYIDGSFPIHYECASDTDSLAKVKMIVERTSANANRTGYHVRKMQLNSWISHINRRTCECDRWEWLFSITLCIYFE